MFSPRFFVSDVNSDIIKLVTYSLMADVLTKR